MGYALQGGFGPHRPGHIALWSLRNPCWPAWHFSTSSGVASLDFSRQSPHLLAVGLQDGTVQLHDVKSRQACPSPSGALSHLLPPSSSSFPPPPPFPPYTHPTPCGRPPGPLPSCMMPNHDPHVIEPVGGPGTPLPLHPPLHPPPSPTPLPFPHPLLITLRLWHPEWHCAAARRKVMIGLPSIIWPLVHFPLELHLAWPPPHLPTPQ